MNIVDHTNKALTGKQKEVMLTHIEQGFVGRCIHCDMTFIVTKHCTIDKETSGFECGCL